MKRLLYIMLLFLTGMSCSDFLEEVSSDQIVPKKVSDYKEFLFGEIYNMRNSNMYHIWLDIMTDDCEEFAKKATLGSDTRVSGYGYYTWQRDPELDMTGTLNDDRAWARYYHEILVANMVLYDVDNVTGSELERDQVKAEAYMIRAYAYYMLVNLYGEPFDPATASSAKGVPINELVGSGNKNYERASVADIYKIIRTDIDHALLHFEKSGGGNTVFRWNKTAANVFASRVALYMQDWSATIEFANKALAANGNLWDLNTKKGAGSISSAEYFFSSNNKEILFTYGNYYINYFATGAKGAFPVSTSLKAIYKSGDLRYGASDGAFIRNQGSTFMGGGKRYLPYKYYETSYTSRHGFAIRTAEAYLNRAEAYVNIAGKEEEAAADLNTLRVARFTPATYSDIVYEDRDDLLSQVKTERRRELCFEQHRWFDLRRWDRPRIEHTFTPDFSNLNEKVVYVLEENDVAYTLPIPNSVLIMDPLTENIDRPEREPLKDK
ncbi:MAG: RagB/SusD family nutrient uptake outer membrane protein [Marinifilaceae bacterium]